jgi:plasmid stabilization system protein ParE
MTRRVKIAAPAEEDFVDRFTHIGLESDEAAERFRLRLLETLRFISESPHFGRRYPVSDPILRGMRVWRVAGFPKILVFYQAEAEEIVVRRILHGAMDLGAELG